MGVAGVAVASVTMPEVVGMPVGMRMTSVAMVLVTVVISMRMVGHLHYSTCPCVAAHLSCAYYAV